MNIDPSVFYKLVWGIGIMSAVLAAAISAVFQLLNSWRERIAADKRHLRDLALKAAIVQWEHDVARTDQENRNLEIGESPIKIGEVHFDMILLKKMKMIETFSKTDLSKRDIQDGIRQMEAIGQAITDEVRVRRETAR